MPLSVLLHVVGLLEVLLDIYGCGQPEGHIMCLLILRNLSFHAPSKALLTSNSEYCVSVAPSKALLANNSEYCVSVAPSKALLANNSEYCVSVAPSKALLASNSEYSVSLWPPPLSLGKNLHLMHFLFCRSHSGYPDGWPGVK